MAQASQFWRTRSAVLSVAGIAAFCGIVAVYSTYTRQSSTGGLHRSNAVHRPRRERYAPRIYRIDATHDAPLGTVVIRQGEEAWKFDLGSTPLPPLDELQRLASQANEQTQAELIDTALDLVLSSCCTTSYSSTLRFATREQNPDSLVVATAMATGDENQVRLHASGLGRLLGLDSISDEAIEGAISKFMGSDAWLRRMELSAEHDDVDPAETENIDLLDSAGREPNQGLRGLLYYIAEEDAKRKAYEHRGITCEECGELPIRGVRWHCLNCPDFDLCASCEPHTEHPKTHVFAKIKIPLPVLSQPTKEYKLWYPGDPRKIHASLDPELRLRLCTTHGFEEAHIDALFDQFTCLANRVWPDDTSAIKAAIDKRAFTTALTCERWSSQARSNALYDRMFSFYDVDGNNLIGFEEFLSGFAYLRGPNRFASLQRAVQGYDMNGDGFVDRTDFLRLLRAKFVIQQQIVRNSIEEQEMEQTQSALDILRSSQPISSIFSQEDIPPGELRPRHQKELDQYGDMRPLHGAKTILEDDDPWPPRVSSEWPHRDLPAHERLRDNLSRFEELLHGPSEPQMDITDHQMDGSDSVFIPEVHDEPSRDEITPLDPLDFESIDGDLLEPHVEDILWQATEDGLHTLLNSLFLSQEQQDQQAINTREERTKWRKDFEAVAEEEGQFLQQRGTKDIALAAHTESCSKSDVQQYHLGAYNTANVFTSDIVSTDPASLERREQDITNMDLSQLLSEAGYGLRNEDEVGDLEVTPGHAPQGSSSESDSFEHQVTPSPLRRVPSRTGMETTNANLSAPTLNVDGRATSVHKSLASRRMRGTPDALNTFEKSPERPPSRRRLEYLSHLDQVDRRLQSRGGPGRLTYAEVESITVASGNEIRGLVKSWLEWASF